MLIKVTPLIQYRNFRRLFFGQFISWFGTMLTFVALPYQIFQITHSSLAVGNVGIVELIPLLITSLWGGALADKLNRRKLLLYSTVGLQISSVLLFFNAILNHPQVTIIYFAAALTSAINGFNRPTLQALIQSLVKSEDMAAVASLNSFAYSIPMVLGPMVAGLILAKFHLSFIYAVDFFTYLIALIAIYSIEAPQMLKQAADPVIHSIHKGFRYALSRQELIGSYVVDFVAMIFGMPMALFPAIATAFHNVSAIGWLFAGPAVGMLVVSLFSGWTYKIKRLGVAIALSASFWGIAIILFGLSSKLLFAVLFLIAAGGADGLSGIFRSTLWNQTIPHHLRGRLAGIEMISYMSGPLLGNAEAGLVAHFLGVKFSVISGGVLCVVGVVAIILWLPRFWRFGSTKNNLF